MNCLKLALAGSTALTLSMSVVFADNNTALLEQSGNTNTGAIDQSNASNSNVGVGGALPAAQQTGDDNLLTIVQSGNANRIGSNTAAAALAQTGDDNTATVTQFRAAPAASPSTSTGNIVTVLTQSGDNHSVTILQSGDQNRNYANVRQSNPGSGADGNTASVTQTNSAGDNQNVNRNEISSGPGHVGGVIQSGERNNAMVVQDGQGLRLRLLQQSGNDNAASVLLSGVDNGQPDLTADGASGASGANSREVLQTGDRNDTDLDIAGARNAYGVSQFGNDNDALGIMITGDDNSIGVGQFGNDNEVALATITGDENSVGFYQFGNDNFGSATVDRDKNNGLISQIGDRNVAYLEVFGTRNDAILSVTGNDNYLNAYQRGRAHRMTVNFDGNGNNNSALAVPLSGAALTAVNFVQASGKLRSANFGAGDLFQLDQSPDNRQRNNLTITGTLADNSSFAMYQNGSENTISGSISNGSNNQAVVAQIGSDNAATFSQTGSNNNAGIIQ